MKFDKQLGKKRLKGFAKGVGKFIKKFDVPPEQRLQIERQKRTIEVERLQGQIKIEKLKSQLNKYKPKQSNKNIFGEI